MQLSSSSSSSAGIGASTRSGHGPPTVPSDPPKDVASAFGSVIFEPGARPAAVKGSSPRRSSLEMAIDEEEEEEVSSSAARDAAAGTMGRGSIDDGVDSQYGSPVGASFPPGDDAGADSRRGSAPSVPPLSPQATPGERLPSAAAKVGPTGHRQPMPGPQAPVVPVYSLLWLKACRGFIQLWRHWIAAG